MTQVRRNLFIVAFSILVLILVTLLTITFAIRRNYLNNLNSGSDNLASATWKIASVEPSSQADGTFTITVQSSIGNIRRYPGVKSYGISNSGGTLAVSTDSNFRFISLATDESREIVLPFSYSGDFGEALTWSPEDEEVAFIAKKTSAGGLPVLIILDTDGTIVSETTDSFYYESVNSRDQYAHAKFSPTSKLILTRTFEDKGSPAALDPASLKVFNVAGNLRKEILIRDTISKADQITYTWSRDGERVLYSADSVGTKVNFAQEYSFNQVFVGF